MNFLREFQSRAPVTDRPHKACFIVNALLRMLGWRDFDDDASLLSSRRTRRHGRVGRTSLMPIRIPVGRRNSR
jgi:hypothetical protein